MLCLHFPLNLCCNFSVKLCKSEKSVRVEDSAFRADLFFSGESSASRYWQSLINSPRTKWLLSHLGTSHKRGECVFWSVFVYIPGLTQRISSPSWYSGTLPSMCRVYSSYPGVRSLQKWSVCVMRFALCIIAAEQSPDSRVITSHLAQSS